MAIQKEHGGCSWRLPSCSDNWPIALTGHKSRFFVKAETKEMPFFFLETDSNGGPLSQALQLGGRKSPILATPKKAAKYTTLIKMFTSSVAGLVLIRALNSGIFMWRGCLFSWVFLSSCWRFLTIEVGPKRFFVGCSSCPFSRAYLVKDETYPAIVWGLLVVVETSIQSSISEY